MENKKKKVGSNVNERPDDYAAEEQGILPKESSEEIKEDMHLGTKEEDPYTKEGREVMEDEDEIDNVEQGFMEGATGGGQLAKDALTGEPLLGEDAVVEMEINGELYRFVNQENAEKFKRKKEED